MNVCAHELRACLLELGDRTREQLADLHADCTVDRCELMVRCLAEVSTVVRRLATELAEGDPPTV